MIIKTDEKQEEQEIKIKVEKGIITRTNENKYLGNWITEN